MDRYGQVIRIKPAKLDEYRKYHENAWPEVLDMITQCNIRNYTIFHKDGYLFAYFEYHGSNFKADMEKMAADSRTQDWWKIMNPMQDPLPTREPGEWWSTMDEVFHTR